MGNHETLETIKMAEAKREISFQHDLYGAPQELCPPPSASGSSHTNAKRDSSETLVRKGVLPAVDLTEVSSPYRSGKVAASKDLNHNHEGEFKEMHLHNRPENHAGADALVYVRKDFDPGQPVHLLIYNHGLGSTVSSALERNQIKEMMANAQANTILVLPEWQAIPGSRNGSSGTFAQQDKFTDMVQEIMQKTPALHGATLDNVDRVDIIAHSAGYSPTEAEIYKNPALSAKVHSITLLDALYDRHGFDKWLGNNIHDLSTGSKQFFNFSNGSTADNSREQAKLVASMLRHKRLSLHNYAADYGSSKRHVDRHAAEMAKRSIVFASTTTGHFEIPGQYIGPTLAALNPEREQASA